MGGRNTREYVVFPEFRSRLNAGTNLIRGKNKSHALPCCDSGQQSRWYAIGLATNINIQSDPEFNQTLTGEDLIYRRLPRERKRERPPFLCLFVSLSLTLSLPSFHVLCISFSPPPSCSLCLVSNIITTSGWRRYLQALHLR